MKKIFVLLFVILGIGIISVGTVFAANHESHFFHPNGDAYHAGSLGIGTTTPANDLTVYTNPSEPQLRLEDRLGGWDFWGGKNLHFMKDGSTSMVIKNDGRVGIGTTTPANDLTVYTNPSEPQLRLEDKFGGWELWGGRNLHFMKDDTTSMVIKEGGRVGIGTENPSTELEVSGTIRADYIQITGNTAWTDWVGSSGGELRSTHGVECPHDKVMVGMDFRRFRDTGGDQEFYQFRAICK